MADYTGSDIAAALAAVGVTAGAAVFSHSNVGFFGRLEGATTPAACWEIYRSAIFEVLGASGTFAVPTFSYSSCNGRPFDPAVTPGQCGMLSEWVRLDSAAVRSADPNFSVAAIGRAAHALCDDVGVHPFGPDSFWARFLANDGWLVNLNFDAGTTFQHFVERELRVPYRWDKSFRGMCRVDGTWVERESWHYVFDHAVAEHFPDFGKLHRAAIEAGVLKSAQLGRGMVVAVRVADLDRIIRRELPRRPDFLIEGRPA